MGEAADSGIALCMIVRDEAHCIERTLASVKDAVKWWTVVDTGSKDDTRERVRRFFHAADVPGRLVEEPFVDYSTTRNAALTHCARDVRTTALGLGGVRWALVLSADETLHGAEALAAFLPEADRSAEDVLLVEMRTEGEVQPQPRLIRMGSPWRYEGLIHEVPVCTTDRTKKATVMVPGVWIEHKATDPERRAKRLTEYDVPALEHALNKIGTDRAFAAERVRLLLLLAQTHEGIAIGKAQSAEAYTQHQFIALGLYSLVANMDGISDGVRIHAIKKYLNVAEIVGVYTAPEMVARLQPLAGAAPDNPEIAYMFAANCMKTANGVDPSVPGGAEARKKAIHQALQVAYASAKVARAAVKDPEHPHDPHGLLWRSHLLAAWCCKQLGHGPAMKKSVEEGLLGGAPPEVFAEFTSNERRPNGKPA